jgi:hypothetical protein
MRNGFLVFASSIHPSSVSKSKIGRSTPNHLINFDEVSSDQR